MRAQNTRYALRAKCRFRLAWLIKRLLCRLGVKFSDSSKDILLTHPPLFILEFQVRWQRGLFRFLVLCCSVSILVEINFSRGPKTDRVVIVLIAGGIMLEG